MPHFEFPSHCIFWTKVDNHEEIKSKYLSKIKSLDESNHNFACNVKSNIKNHVKFLDEDDYNKLVWNPIDRMIEESGGDLYLGESFIQSYWYNKYDVNDFQEKHEHSAYPIEINDKLYHPSLSIIYILNDENKNASTLFVDKNPVPFGPSLKFASFDTSKVKEIKEGTVIIFSSRLEHMVKPIKVGGRITIAFNIFSSFS
jgi:hypothetical protein